MKQYSYRPCSCTNQHHLQSGEYCEICNGIVDDNIDANQSTTFNQQSDFFGFDYFEDLELYLDTAIHAA